MSLQRGAASEILIGFESTYGTAASAGYKMPFVTYEVKPTQPPQESAVLKNNLNPVKPFYGPKEVGGGVSVPCDSTSFGWWLRALLGSPTTTGTGPYEHVFTKDALEEQPSLTMEQSLPDLTTDVYDRAVGCKINKWSMGFGDDGELLCKMDVIGSDWARQSSSFDAAATDATSYTQLHNHQGAVYEGGSSSDTILKLSFDVDAKLEPLKAFNGSLAKLPEGRMGISGSLTAMMDDDGDTLRAKADGGVTETSLKVVLTASSSSILEIEFPEVFLELTAPGVTTPAGLLVEMNWMAFYDDNSDNTAIKVTLTNSQASY